LLDGAGYPDGLRGDQISDIVRLTTIVDIHAALVEKRAYRLPFTHAKARSWNRWTASSTRICFRLSARWPLDPFDCLAGHAALSQQLAQFRFQANPQTRHPEVRASSASLEG
jgi:hypothetical protein